MTNIEDIYNPRGVDNLMFQRGVDMFLRFYKHLIIFVITICCLYKFIKAKHEACKYILLDTYIGNTFYSMCLDWFSTPLCRDDRQIVKDATLKIKHTNPRNHSHPDAAKTRCIANTTMDHIAVLLGRRAYHYQMSPTQQRLQLIGSRTIHCAKDMQMRYQNNSLNRDDIVILTDVDYYLDMNTMLRGNPLLIYSFVPNEVSGMVADGVYCTHSDDTVEITHAGGAVYRHHLWDYDNDHVVVDTLTGSYIYLIEQLHIDDNHRIIYLNPVRFIYGPFGWILPGRMLLRRKFNVAGVVHSKFTKRGEDKQLKVWHSLSLAGEHNSCTIPSDTFHATYIRLAENKEPHLSDVERYFNSYGIDNTIFAASLFFHIFKHNRQIFDVKPRMTTPCVVQDRHTYQAVGPLVSEDGKPSMRALWPGLSKSAFSPAKSFNNDYACLQGRVFDVKNNKPDLPPIYYAYVREFIDFIVPLKARHTLCPLSYEQIWEQFDRATQRSLLAKADFNSDAKTFVRSFQKREAYAKITAPRNISTLPMAHNFRLGQFTHPLLEHFFKKSHWYAFGKHPTETAMILHAKACGASYAVTSDYNKLDGSAGHPVFRDLFVGIMKAAYAMEYHDEITRLESKERYAKCSTTFGLKYDADHTILSGSSMTSLLGTLINAYTMYCALRLSHDSETAWKSLGVYGGDDGVSFDIPPEHIQKTAAKFGLLVEAKAISKGSVVDFLGRWYIDLWTSPQSIADVPRQLKKLHLTTAPADVPDWLCLYRKAVGYRVTDARTPFLTCWCDKVIALVKEKMEFEIIPSTVAGPTTPEELPLYKQTANDTVYWSKFESPFVPPTDMYYVKGLVANALGWSAGELDAYEQRIYTATKIEDLYFTDIFTCEVTQTVDAVLQGEVRKMTKKPPNTQEKIKANGALKTDLCRYTRRGETCPYTNCKFTHNKIPTLKTKTNKNVKT